MVSNIPKIWYRFSKSLNRGKIVNFRWEQLPNHRFKEFVDFKMKYYVRHETTHTVAGIYRNPEAMNEYKQIVANLYKNPSYHTSICCVDDGSNKMVGFSSMNLYNKGEIYKDVMDAKTAEVKFFYQILHKWNNLCPVPDILIKYGVNQYFDGAGVAIHPDYRGYRFSDEVVHLRSIVCKANNVPLTGAWLTSKSIQNATKSWETLYEVTPERLENILGIKFPDAKHSFVYRVKMIS